MMARQGKCAIQVMSLVWNNDKMHISLVFPRLLPNTQLHNARTTSTSLRTIHSKITYICY